jgi:hypothetical protein
MNGTAELPLHPSRRHPLFEGRGVAFVEDDEE